MGFFNTLLSAAPGLQGLQGLLGGNKAEAPAAQAPVAQAAASPVLQMHHAAPTGRPIAEAIAQAPVTAAPIAQTGAKPTLPEFLHRMAIELNGLRTTIGDLNLDNFTKKILSAINETLIALGFPQVGMLVTPAEQAALDQATKAQAEAPAAQAQIAPVAESPMSEANLANLVELFKSLGGAQDQATPAATSTPVGSPLAQAQIAPGPVQAPAKTQAA